MTGTAATLRCRHELPRPATLPRGSGARTRIRACRSAGRRGAARAGRGDPLVSARARSRRRVRRRMARGAGIEPAAGGDVVDPFARGSAFSSSRRLRRKRRVRATKALLRILIAELRVNGRHDSSPPTASSRPTAPPRPGFAQRQEKWRRWESNPRPRSRMNGFYERSRRSDLIPRSPRRRGYGGPASLSVPGLAKADRAG